MLFEVTKRTSILALGRAHHGFKSLTPTVLVLFRKNVILSYTRFSKSTKYVKRHISQTVNSSVKKNYKVKV